MVLIFKIRLQTSLIDPFVQTEIIFIYTKFSQMETLGAFKILIFRSMQD